jgi:hypothetical protein
MHTIDVIPLCEDSGGLLTSRPTRGRGDEALRPSSTLNDRCVVESALAGEPVFSMTSGIAAEYTHNYECLSWKNKPLNSRPKI